MNSPEAVIALLASAPDIIIPMIREVPPLLLKRSPEPGRWSVHEHACHLSKLHPIFQTRLDLLLSTDYPTITPVDPAKEDQDGALLAEDLDKALDRFARDRQILVDRIRKLSPEDWKREAAHTEYSRYSVLIMFRHMALHDMDHAYQIETVLLQKHWD
jgi:hypothetical protein